METSLLYHIGLLMALQAALCALLNLEITEQFNMPITH